MTFLEVTDSNHVQCKSGKISETVQDTEVITAHH